MSARKFPGKIILFGEYTVLEGYRALALPYLACHGTWGTSAEIDQQLWIWLDFLKSLSQKVNWLLPASLKSFEQDIQNKWQFKSTIPQGYGAGSSGAFVASWYDRYIGNQHLPLAELQTRLALLEAQFHGKSSGLDPLVSLLESALMVQGGEIQKVPLRQFDFPAPMSLFDTGIARSTEPIVAIFRQKKQAHFFVEEVLPKLGQAQEFAIDAFLLGDWKTVSEQMAVISELQYEHFLEMIPPGLRSSWAEGLATGDYYKLCGAGGGGYMLKWNSNLI